MSSHKLLRRPYSCSGLITCLCTILITLAPPTRPPGVAPSSHVSHVNEYASPFLSEIFSECVVVQNLRHRGMAQVSDYGWILISSALMIPGQGRTQDLELGGAQNAEVGWLLEGHAPSCSSWGGGGGGVVWGSAVSFPIGVSGEAAVADPGLAVRGAY